MFLSISHSCLSLFFFFFFNDTATTEIYTLSLHDALPICAPTGADLIADVTAHAIRQLPGVAAMVQRSGDRKSTRLNSSHANISYAVFCLKKKKTVEGGASPTKPGHRTRRSPAGRLSRQPA